MDFVYTAVLEPISHDGRWIPLRWHIDGSFAIYTELYTSADLPSSSRMLSWRFRVFASLTLHRKAGVLSLHSRGVHSVDSLIFHGVHGMLAVCHRVDFLLASRRVINGCEVSSVVSSEIGDRDGNLPHCS